MGHAPSPNSWLDSPTTSTTPRISAWFSTPRSSDAWQSTTSPATFGFQWAARQLRLSLRTAVSSWASRSWLTRHRLSSPCRTLLRFQLLACLSIWTELRARSVKATAALLLWAREAPAPILGAKVLTETSTCFQTSRTWALSVSKWARLETTAMLKVVVAAELSSMLTVSKFKLKAPPFKQTRCPLPTQAPSTTL